MQIRVKHAGTFLLFVLMLESGCVTKALWTNDNLEAFKEPSCPNHLRLYRFDEKQDLLVVYDEYSERSDRIRTRAYLLDQNKTRLGEKRAPHFVSTKLTNNLVSVPVFNSIPNEAKLSLYAVANELDSFTIYSAAHEISSHDLPVYNDGKGRVEKVILTPASATADLTVVGSVIGFWYLYGLAQSNYHTP